MQLVQLGNTVWGGVDPLATRALAAQTVQVGPVPWLEVPGYLALADAFVQPGSPDDFNRYRLPSKLPEFLAMGRPVILPHCNLGNELIRRAECAPARVRDDFGNRQRHSQADRRPVPA